jgi:hypothetical protein
MRKLIITILILGLGSTALQAGATIESERVGLEEAAAVARSWVALITQKTGAWGGSQVAQVEECREIRREQRTLGYFCRVIPTGYVVTSLYRVLTPVKFYSEVSDLDPQLNEGMADLVKVVLERALHGIEQTPPEALESILETDYRLSWRELSRATKAAVEMNYAEGQIMLSTSWDQGNPYWQDVPAPPPGSTCPNPHCFVGCSATAMAQIMRYWAWPPYGVSVPYSDTYDWRNMPDDVQGTSPQAEIDAVAELSSEAGLAANMSYCAGGECGSAAGTVDSMNGLTGSFRFATDATREERRLYANTAAWFDMIQGDLNANRPVFYEIPGHSIVVTGWREVGTDKEVHVNYGWGGMHDGWYTLEYEIPGADPDWQWEKAIKNGRPAQALGSALAGTYSRVSSFPYRYFDRDTVATSATFSAGQNLQFLPGVKVVATGSGSLIRFEGSTGYTTRLFSDGDNTKGIKLDNGTIKLSQNGGIRIDYRK